MKLSLIIPVYNECAAIASCLQNLSALEGDLEILFADGGSGDGTAEAVAAAGYRVVPCPKGRSAQMNAAAAQAAGEVLWFTHCDSLLPPDGPRQILQAVEAGAGFGCFHIAFDYRGPFMGCNTYFSNRRARRRHIAFGDQGIFLTRALFDAVGGFPDLPLMEDYELSRTLRRRGAVLQVLPGTILTSGRRYREGGPLRTMAWMFWLRCLYRAGVDIQRIAALYRDVR